MIIFLSSLTKKRPQTDFLAPNSSKKLLIKKLLKYKTPLAIGIVTTILLIVLLVFIFFSNKNAKTSIKQETPNKEVNTGNKEVNNAEVISKQNSQSKDKIVKNELEKNSAIPIEKESSFENINNTQILTENFNNMQNNMINLLKFLLNLNLENNNGEISEKNFLQYLNLTFTDKDNQNMFNIENELQNFVSLMKKNGYSLYKQQYQKGDQTYIFGIEIFRDRYEFFIQLNQLNNIMPVGDSFEIIKYNSQTGIDIKPNKHEQSVGVLKWNGANLVLEIPFQRANPATLFTNTENVLQQKFLIIKDLIKEVEKLTQEQFYEYLKK